MTEQTKPWAQLFKGPYYRKPTIRKVKGTGIWSCHHDNYVLVWGFGLSPAEAYRDWKSRQC